MQIIRKHVFFLIITYDAFFYYYNLFSNILCFTFHLHCQCSILYVIQHYVYSLYLTLNYKHDNAVVNTSDKNVVPDIWRNTNNLFHLGRPLEFDHCAIIAGTQTHMQTETDIQTETQSQQSTTASDTRSTRRASKASSILLPFQGEASPILLPSRLQASWGDNSPVPRRDSDVQVFWLQAVCAGRMHNRHSLHKG